MVISEVEKDEALSDCLVSENCTVEYLLFCNSNTRGC